MEDLTDLIKRYGELKEESNERYLSGILDFFKWTTTFAFAVIVWIGSNIQNQTYKSSFLLYLSIIFVLASITSSIITTYLILDSWNKDRKLKFHIHQLLVISQVDQKHPSEIGKNDIEKEREAVIGAAKTMFVLERFDRHLIFQISTLFIGIILYLFAIYI
jgi:hypothetical protein